MFYYFECRVNDYFHVSVQYECQSNADLGSLHILGRWVNYLAIVSRILCQNCGGFCDQIFLSGFWPDLVGLEHLFSVQFYWDREYSVKYHPDRESTLFTIYYSTSEKYRTLL